MKHIPYNKAHITGKELHYISQVLQSGELAGDGKFTKLCSNLLEKKFNIKKVLLTNSGTAALDMCAMLCNIKPGDEVIMSTFTHPSTANAFLLRGATIKFIDISTHSIGINVDLIESAINENTKVIVPVHYAGNSSRMDVIMSLAEHYNLIVVEDAAQAMGSTYNSQYLGTIGHLGVFSFHNTKNIISGEGGALLINDEKYIERAEMIRDCGTNRSQFFRREVRKYGWSDIGSSYLPSEIITAILYAQLEEFDDIEEKRLGAYKYYYRNLLPLTRSHFDIFMPHFANDRYNGHIFYLTLRNENAEDLISYLHTTNIRATTHFVPLHTSPMGLKLGHKVGDFPIAEMISKHLVRLPLYVDITKEDQDIVIDNIYDFYHKERA